MQWWIISPDYPLTKKKGVCTPPIDDLFSYQHLLALAISSALGYTDLVNYWAYAITPQDMNSNQKKCFFSQAKIILLRGALLV